MRVVVEMGDPAERTVIKVARDRIVRKLVGRHTVGHMRAGDKIGRMAAESG